MQTTTDILYYAEPQQIEADGCFAIAFIRPTGSNPVNVQGYPLAEGETLSISQNVGDTDHTSYDINFSTGTGTNEVYVIKTMPK